MVRLDHEWASFRGRRHGRVRHAIDAPLVERTSCGPWPHAHDVIAQPTRHGHNRFVGADADRQLSSPPSNSIRPPPCVHRRFHKGPSQPRRSFARDAARAIAVATRVHPRHQAGVTGQRGAARKPRDVADLGADRQGEHRPDPDERVEGLRDGIGGRMVRDGGLRGHHLGLDRIEDPAQPGE
jgi:hypothetical protein